MNNQTLAESYLAKSTTRLKVLDLLLKEEAYSDVVREAQEAVEKPANLPRGRYLGCFMDKQLLTNVETMYKL